MSILGSKRNVFIGAFLIFFGLMTIISGGKALFTEVGHETRGNIVPLVLWFNFIAGFFYILAGVATYNLRGCVKKLSVLLAFTNVAVFIYLLNHIFQGELYETRTLVAMSIRTSLWVFISLYFFKSDIFKDSRCGC